MIVYLGLKALDCDVTHHLFTVATVASCKYLNAAKQKGILFGLAAVQYLPGDPIEMSHPHFCATLGCIFFHYFPVKNEK